MIAPRSRRMKLSLLLMALGGIVLSIMVGFAYSQTWSVQQEDQAIPEKGLLLIGAGIAAGLAAFGAGLGLGTASAAAIGAIAEKPELFGRTLIYIVLIEAIAIYGLAMFFVIYSRI